MPIKATRRLSGKKNNRARLLAPRVHTFTAETNQKKGKEREKHERRELMLNYKIKNTVEY